MLRHNINVLLDNEHVRCFLKLKIENGNGKNQKEKKNVKCQQKMISTIKNNFL